MEDDEDYLMRPVLRGLCRYESLKDGTLSLFDVSVMHEALDIDAENQSRVQKYMESKNVR